MEPSDVDKALATLRGVRERDPDLASRHVHPRRYREHNPDAANGLPGLREWVSGLPPTGGQNTVRILLDGSHVVTHSTGDLPAPCAFFDVFRFDEDKIVEHWLFREAAAPVNPSGHVQTDGPIKPAHLQETEANKALVRRYYDTVHIAGHHDEIPKYVSEDHIRHEPGVHDGLAAFLLDLDRFNGPGKPSRTFGEVKLTLGEGDLVFVAATGTLEADPCVYVDLYRAEGGRLVEHWAFIEKVPPQSGRKNDNDML